MNYKSEAFDEMCKKYKKSTITMEEAATEAGVGISDIKFVIESGELEVKKIGLKEVILIQSFLKFLTGEAAEATVDNTSMRTVTSLPQENVEIVEDGVDMGKGTVAFIKQSNLWIFQLDLGKAQNGKRIRKTASFKTEVEARDALAREIELIKANSENENSNFSMTTDTTVKDYLNYYLSLECGRGSSRTRENYYFAASKICAMIGDVKLMAVKSEELMKVLTDYKKKYSQSTVDKVFIVLNTAFKYAFETEILAKNLMRNISKPKSTKAKDNLYKAYSQAEITDLVQASRSYPEMRPIISILLNTGMRPGELRALKWQNIDFEENTVYIKEAATFDFVNDEIGVNPKMKEIISCTKSAYSVRKLTIPKEIMTELKEWRDYVNTSKAYKKARNSPFVFPSPTGSFIGDSVLRNRYKKFLSKEGFDDGFTLYRFRHTMCTFLIKEGIDIPTIQRIMGDNTTDVILKIYTSINADDIKKASVKIQNVLCQFVNTSYNITD